MCIVRLFLLSKILPAACLQSARVTAIGKRANSLQGNDVERVASWGARKVPTMPQVLSSVQHICFPKTCFRHGGTIKPRYPSGSESSVDEDYVY